MSNPFSYNQSLLSSAQDSIWKHCNTSRSRLERTNQFVLCWLHRGNLLEQEASAERSQVCHSEKEGLMSSSSQGLNVIGTGRTCCIVFTSESVESRRIFWEEKENFFDVLGSNDSIFWFSKPGESCEISSWWKQTSLAYWKESRIDEAGAKSGITLQL